MISYDNHCSGTAWLDLTNNKYNGTLTNGASFSSANLGNIATDGIDDYVAIPTLSNVTTTRTVELIYKQNDISSGYGPLWRDYWRERIFPNQIVLINSNSTYYYLSGPDNTTNIINICYSFNGTNAKSYKNGVLATNITMDGPMHNQTNYYRLGFQCSGASCVYTNCNLYLFKVYDRQLTDTEVMRNYMSSRSRFGI